MMIANKVWIIIFARALQGCAAGLSLTTMPMYLSEITTDKLRGATGSLIRPGTVIGILYVYSIGPYVSYQALQWFCIAIPILFASVFVFMPESPHYYVSKKRMEDASKSLQFLRGQSAAAVQDALKEIENFIQESGAQKGTFKDVFKTAGNRKALLISVLLLGFHQLTGNTAVLFNTQSIFNTANTGTDSALSAIIVALVQLLAAVLAPLVVDRLGRRLILLVCSAIMSIVLFALGAYFYIEINGGETVNILWLPLTSLIIYIIFYNVSFGPLPYVILSEIFPNNIKSVASSIGIITSQSTSFLMSFLFPLLNDLGTYYAFWLYAVFCVIAFLFVLTVVFETKGLSLQEIQDKLNKNDVVK